jgi:hypothetical protein
VNEGGRGWLGAEADGADEEMRAHPEATAVGLRVVAGARRTEPAGVAGQALRVRVAAPPAQGPCTPQEAYGEWSSPRQMRSRSCSERPPHTPYGSRVEIA